MRWHLSILPASAMLAGALALPPHARDVPPTAPESLTRTFEVARLRAHFDSVDTELRHPQAVPSTASQQASRLTLIGWLREYRDAGRFPINDRFPDRAMPFFRDSQGTLCAMAYLIDRSGRGDIVDRVAATRNNGYIPELADDPALKAWLDSTGLSVAEAARIQPAYRQDVIEGDPVSTEYAVTSALVSGASLTTFILNFARPSTTSGYVGVAAGTAAFLAGAANLDRDGETEGVAVANMIIGSGAIAAGIYRLRNPRQARVSVGPGVIPTSTGPQLGLAVHGSF